MPSPSRLQKLLAGVALAGVFGGAWFVLAGPRSGAVPSPEQPRSDTVPRPQRPSSSGTVKSPETPQTIVTRAESAYGARLFALPGELLLVTGSALVRIQDDGTVREFPGHFDVAPALLGDDVVSVHEGAIVAMPREGGEPRSLGRAPRTPQFIVSDGNALALFSHELGGSSTIHAFEPDGARLLYETPGQLTSPVALDGFAYFVEHRDGSSYRIGRVALVGGPPDYSAPRSGRSPSMLAAGPGGVSFYDGPARQVVRLAADLSGTETLAKRTICSPLSVLTDVYCGQVGAIVRLPAAGGGPVVFARESAGPVTALAQRGDQVFWIVDSGRDQLLVRTAPSPR